MNKNKMSESFSQIAGSNLLKSWTEFGMLLGADQTNKSFAPLAGKQLKEGDGRLMGLVNSNNAKISNMQREFLEKQGSSI